MSTLFLYEDGHGNVIDENGSSEPMDYVVDQNEFIVEIIATHTDYLKHAVSNESSSTCPMLVEKAKNKRCPYEGGEHKKRLCTLYRPG